MFRLFAKMIGEGLDAQYLLSESQNALAHEQELAVAQEQFIAILAHDLRNPIAAMTSGLRLIERCEIDKEAGELVDLLRPSVSRMALLTENLLDQARKRDGGGIVIERTAADNLAEALTQIVNELQTVSPDQEITTLIEIEGPAYCDVPRISQLFSNLLGNAVTHGGGENPIRVSASLVDEDFVLTVTNGGDKIPTEHLPHLFSPYKRVNDKPSRAGLGLGLYIASEIAAGHDGTLSVTSDDVSTTFTFKMPNLALV
tara:strand:+ start:4026 stop:4796 length:771 start_codon:yes stop_codon:yes gene_type:complete